MNTSLSGLQGQRAWIALVVVLAAILLVIAHAFVGTIVFGLFLYYAVRPVNRLIRRITTSRGIAAALTLFLVVLPLFALFGYALFLSIEGLNTLLNRQLLSGLQPYINVSAILDEPRDAINFVQRLRQPGPLQEVISTSIGVLGAIATWFIHFSMIIAIVYYLLRDGPRIADWFREEIGTGSAAYAYVSAVDADLESVYFGNVIAIAMITVLSIVWYNAYNVIAPDPVTIPFPTLLALLTGVASIVPIVVGKIVYLPITAYLVIVALRANSELLWYPTLFVAVAFVFLDFIPQTFVQPYIAGRHIHVGLMIFAYVFGGLFFGWYGLFLGPIILVLSLQAIRLVVTDLLRGGPVTPNPTAAKDLGSDPALEDR